MCVTLNVANTKKCINVVFNTVEPKIYTVQYNYCMAIRRWNHNSFRGKKTKKYRFISHFDSVPIKYVHLS